MSEPLLEVDDLRIDFVRHDRTFHAVRGVDLRVCRDETVCIVGESGCGKSLTALGLVGLLPAGASRRARTIRFGGVDLLAADARRMRAIRGDRIGMVFQNPMTSLNPSMRIGRQVAEVLCRHRGTSRADAIRQAGHMLERVGIPAEAQPLQAYPHQLSGGQRQRVMIAMALACEPDLVIADEPTTALDVTIQVQILALLAKLRRETGGALLMITHDLGLVSRIADRVVVMYAGEVVEEGDVRAVLARPAHPYTQALLGALPVIGTTVRRTPLDAIPGLIPGSPGSLPGCTFADRCRNVEPRCREGTIALRAVGPDQRSRCIVATARSSPPAPSRPCATAPAPGPSPDPATGTAVGYALELCELRRSYRMPGWRLGGRRAIDAVAGVSLRIRRGGTLGLVGESGSGKSTLARLALGLESPDSGQVMLEGASAASLGRRARARIVQPVLQDPYSSLNPRHTIADIVEAPLRIHGVGDRGSRATQVRRMLDQVGLPQRLVTERPHQLSGGQRQRVAIARALILRPRIVVCDEPTSSLDVSVQAQILNLLLELQRDLGLTYLLISHNLAVVAHLSDRVAVMYAGRIVEEASAADIFDRPLHPYTRTLIGSLLSPAPGAGLPASADHAPAPVAAAARASGCAFHARCRDASQTCRSTAPVPRIVGDGTVECHLYGPDDRRASDRRPATGHG